MIAVIGEARRRTVINKGDRLARGMPQEIPCLKIFAAKIPAPLAKWLPVPLRERILAEDDGLKFA